MIVTTSHRPPTIDPLAAARWHAAAPAQSPWLHEEVGRRMEERLQWITLQPEVWCDWEPVRGGLDTHAKVQQRYPQSRCHVVETAPAHASRAQALWALPWWRPGRWTGAQTQFTPPLNGTSQLLWSNMALHTVADPQALLAQWHRALTVDGFLMFSCLGPDTVRELHGVYAALGWPPAGHAFTDMHDWGDMLVHAGFAEPVMDMERITLGFPSAERLLVELRELGCNLHPARFPALRGKQWRQRLCDALTEQLADPGQGGQLILTFEVIYGHAFKPLPRAAVKDQTEVSLEAMRQMLHGRPTR